MDNKTILEYAKGKLEGLAISEDLKDVLRTLFFAIKYLTFNEEVSHKGVNILAKRLENAENELQSLNRRVSDLEYYHN